MENSNKRKASPHEELTLKDKKQKKKWRTPKKGNQSTAHAMESGCAGIWATCAMGKEGKSTTDLRDLFEDYAVKIYGANISPYDGSTEGNNRGKEEDDDGGEDDIETVISAEVRSMKTASTKQESLFQAVKIDVQCVLFFKTRLPVEPVAFVHRICQDAAEGKAVSKCRFVKRLTPMSRMAKATVGGLAEVCGQVLPPVFGGGGGGGGGEQGQTKKFAIRPTIRNNNVMKRDDVIKQMAAAVGTGHKVDLGNPEVIILVDIYRRFAPLDERPGPPATLGPFWYETEDGV
ncbi:MAG: hypothetical protein Q9217_002947 [Psora testacea]